MQLDEQQEAAVNSTADKTLVMASAGSGKTRVLVERIAHLITDQRVSAYEILAFSFTRKSAGELKERLVSRLGPIANRIMVGTTHSIAANMIRRYSTRANIKNSVIYGSVETDLVIKDIAEDTGVLVKKKWTPPRKEIDRALLNYGATGMSPCDTDPARAFFGALKNRLKHNNAMTYDDLLVEFLALIPTLAKYIDWKHLLVDECQDLTPLQFQIVASISNNFPTTVFAVGDLSQSIYRFRGADPANILRLQSTYKTFLLENNYRSVGPIVAAGESVISHAKSRITMDVVAKRGFPPPMVKRVVRTDGVDSEIVSAMAVFDSQDREVAILSRTHSLLQKVSRLLTDRGVEHLYVGTKNTMLKEAPAVIFHSFLRLCVNRYDNFSFMCIRKALGISDIEYAEIRLMATSSDISDFEQWHFYAKDAELVSFFRMTNALEAIFWLSTNVTVTPEFAPVVRFAVEWTTPGDSSIKSGFSIQAYLDYVATFDVQDEYPVDDQDRPKVILSTIHGAKGLEFEEVILIGMNEGIFPGHRALEDPLELLDEIRLCYVGITRARDYLGLTSRPVISIDQKGNTKTQSESRFIDWAMSGRMGMDL
jgi:superfamily I DNA/RNA helicase